MREKFFVESPERGLLGGVGNNSKVAIHERELGMRNIEVEGAFDDRFVADEIGNKHNIVDISHNLVSRKLVKSDRCDE